MKERGVEGYRSGRKRPQRTEIIKNKAWRYSLKSFNIINLGSLKRVGDKKRAVKKKNPSDEPARQEKMVQSSESQADPRPLISCVPPLGRGVGAVHGAGRRPQGADGAEQPYRGCPTRCGLSAGLEQAQPFWVVSWSMSDGI